jgi:hypothetical protein
MYDIRDVQFPDDDCRGDSQNIGLLAVQPPDMAASPRKFIKFGHCESSSNVNFLGSADSPI